MGRLCIALDHPDSPMIMIGGVASSSTPHDSPPAPAHEPPGLGGLHPGGVRPAPAGLALSGSLRRVEVTEHSRDGIRGHGDRAMGRETVIRAGGAIGEADIVPGLTSHASAAAQVAGPIRRLGPACSHPPERRRGRSMILGGRPRRGRGPVCPHAETSRGRTDQQDRERDRSELSEPHGFQDSLGQGQDQGGHGSPRREPDRGGDRGFQ